MPPEFKRRREAGKPTRSELYKFDFPTLVSRRLRRGGGGGAGTPHDDPDLIPGSTYELPRPLTHFFLFFTFPQAWLPRDPDEVSANPHPVSFRGSPNAVYPDPMKTGDVMLAASTMQRVQGEEGAVIAGSDTNTMVTVIPMD